MHSMRHQQSAWVGFGVLVAFGFASQLPVFGQSETAGELDGFTFVGRTGEKGSEEGYEDTFIFVSGTFRSTACDEYGFNATPYTTTPEEGDVVVFDAVAFSEAEGAMTWHGRVDGEDLEGTVVWEKPGQEPIEYWFWGSIED